MLTVTASSASELFAAACRAVLASGKPGAPRGLSTVEVLGVTLSASQLHQPRVLTSTSSRRSPRRPS